MLPSIARAREGETMVSKVVKFVKGHMGGNEIILLYGDQIPMGEEMNFAQKLLNRPHIRGDQVGFIYKAEKASSLRIRIAEIGAGRFIPMCGGLTQVLGFALVETDFADYLDIKIREPVTNIVLETDTGPIPIEIESNRGKAERVCTCMKSYIRRAHKLGVQSLKVFGVDVFKVGDFVVVNADDVKKVYAHVDFEEMDDLTLGLLSKISSELYTSVEYAPASDMGLYDLHPEHGGDARAVFPCNVLTGHIEPSCGTGTTVIGMAMVARGQAKVKGGVATIKIECGGKRGIGGPNMAELRAVVNNGRVVDAEFHHNEVEILAVGRVYA